MKNMIELPKQSDFHQTTIVDINTNNQQFSGGIINHDFKTQKELLIYRKGIVAMRSIVDVFESNLPLTVIDEEKYPEYLEKVEEFKKAKYPPVRLGSLSPVPAELEQKDIVGNENENFNDIIADDCYSNEFPQPPTKKIIVPTTIVLYFNGVQRAMVDNYDEFLEVYFNYLQAQKLDIV